jgi:hypothetical protein
MPRDIRDVTPAYETLRFVAAVCIGRTIAPPPWVVEVCLEVGEAGQLAYTHDAGGPDEWKVVIALASHA